MLRSLLTILISSSSVFCIGQSVTLLEGSRLACKNETSEYQLDIHVLKSTEVHWEVSGGEIISKDDNLAKIKWLSSGEQTLKVAVLKADETLLFLQDKVIVESTPEIALLSSDTVCSGDTLVAVAPVDQADRMEWYLNGELVSNQLEIADIAVPSSSTSHELEVVAYSGNCSSSSKKSIYSQFTPQPEISVEKTHLSPFEKSTISFQGNILTSTILEWSDDEAFHHVNEENGKTLYFWDTPGTKQLRLRAEENGCVSSISMEVEVKSAEAINTSFTTYPSPAKENLFLKLDSEDFSRYQIVSLDGKIVREGNLDAFTDFISVSDLSNGSYILILENGQQSKFEVLR